MTDQSPGSHTLASSAAISGDPFKESEYFERAEHSLERHWAYFIEPVIGTRRYGLTIDLAVGWGRNTEKLRHISDQVIGVDINQECVDHCAKRFEGVDNVGFIKTDGTELTGIADNSVDLIYCFDAMVHFQPEIVDAYVTEFARVLKPGGIGFIHHSNWTQAIGGNFQEQPHWRNYMSSSLFGYFVYRDGMKMLEQRIIDWDQSIQSEKEPSGLVKQLDCISCFTKP